MNWLNELFWKESIAHTILIYSLVITTGILLGKIKIKGISLGATFVLFAGIIAGHIGFRINPDVLSFIKDFGLVLFVFFIGLQVGPGFFSSLKKGGLALNLLAVSVVLLGTLTTIILHFVSGISMPIMAGIMSGAVTNTPGLGAAQQALKQVSDSVGGSIPDIGIGYAVAYPMGVVGIILSMIIIKRVSKTDINSESKNYERKQHPQEAIPEKISITIENPEVFGKKIKECDHYLINEAIISRVQQNNEIKISDSETVLNKGDIILLIAEKGNIPDLIKLFGSKSEKDISTVPGKLMSKQVIITNRHVMGKTLASLKLRSRFGINITRIYRSGIEFVATRTIKLQIGDKLTIVGDEASIDNAADLLGNSIKRLNEPNLFPIFMGIILGVILGSIPIAIQGIPTPIKLGMAGGPLIVAILLSRYGYNFSLNSYTTPSANMMLREIGIVLFLASVGIKAGENFIPSLISGDGFIWMGYGAIITLVPVIIIGFITKIFLKRNFLEIC
ncbi:MAG: putative transporter, partial [Bacteroidetes bacterium]|nr:putative transporter [Bacteroidota bacterium]